MKKRLLLSALTCGILMGATGLQAQTEKKALLRNMVQNEIKNHQKAPKEIVAGMQHTFMALKSLQANKKDEAKQALEAATKSFDAALKTDPTLDLIPIDERFQSYAFVGDSKVIASRLELAQQLLKAHDTQTAMATIAPLKDELDISIISIPMKIYPLATKKALDALNKGHDKEAFKAIAAAMNSLVIVKVVIPAPLLVAQDLVVEASKLDKNKKDEVQKLLSAAKEELKRAELLGYVSRHESDYKRLNDEIEKIEKEIEGKNIVEKLYETLKSDFEKIIANTKISKMTPEQVAEKRVNDFEKKEAEKAVKEKNEFKQEAKQDEK
jgi:hypothetical protein